jgi:hypothetical protein
MRQAVGSFNFLANSISGSGSAYHVISIAIALSVSIPTIQLPPLSFPQGESVLDSLCLVLEIQLLALQWQSCLWFGPCLLTARNFRLLRLLKYLPRGFFDT